MYTVVEGNSDRASNSPHTAVQRDTLCVSNSYTAQAQPSRGAGARNLLTNEFVDMITYQVLIQTLQLSERNRTVGPESLKKV
jgi:hypothetical protein